MPPTRHLALLEHMTPSQPGPHEVADREVTLPTLVALLASGRHV